MILSCLGLGWLQSICCWLSKLVLCLGDGDGVHYYAIIISKPTLGDVGFCYILVELIIISVSSHHRHGIYVPFFKRLLKVSTQPPNLLHSFPAPSWYLWDIIFARCVHIICLLICKCNSKEIIKSTCLYTGKQVATTYLLMRWMIPSIITLLSNLSVLNYNGLF